MGWSSREVETSIKAILAKKLVEYGFTQRTVARALGVSPATITYYVSGCRGDQELIKLLLSDQKFVKLLESHTIRCAEAIQRGNYDMVRASVNDLTLIAQSLLRRGGEGGELEARIRDRIKLEVGTAQRALILAEKTKDPVLKAVFLQIASDSLRHIDILSSIVEYVRSERRISLDVNVEEIEALAREESEMHDAVERDLSALTGDEIINALLRSIEIDERKHYDLIAILSARGRGSGGKE